MDKKQYKLLLLWICTKLGFVDMMHSCKCNHGNNLTGTFNESAVYTPQPNRNIEIKGDKIILDDKYTHILSGSLHYFRVPSEYWRDRLKKLKAAGLNSVSTYVEWSFHEPEEREYFFCGDRDVARFVQLAAKEGLHVLLCPGPYIGAERDLGGLPYWLLGKYPRIQLRSSDKDFMKETEIWLDKLFGEIKPLLYGNGGPIILVQIENQYSKYGRDNSYKEMLAKLISKHVNFNAVLYTNDLKYTRHIKTGAVANALATVNFGAGEHRKGTLASLRKFMSHRGPLMNSEFYLGWFSTWGQHYLTVDIKAITQTLQDMLDHKVHINFYMFCGGTNFGFTSGASSLPYKPVITSYDYNAPINEAGDLTSKYFAIRDILLAFNGKAKTMEPRHSPKAAYGKLKLDPKLYLLSLKGRKHLGKEYKNITGSVLPTFESLRQRSGFVLYEALVNTSGFLQINKPRDGVYVYLDNKLQGHMSRIYGPFKLRLKTKNNAKLSLLVENQGRISSGPPQEFHDFKGILGRIQISDNVLNCTWTITGFPLNYIRSLCAHKNCNLKKNKFKEGPIMFQGILILPSGDKPGDTFIDTAGWGKGYIWVNGHNLGRYWVEPGPLMTLFVPGVWLQPGPIPNYIQLLELKQAHPNMTVEFIDHPIVTRQTLKEFV